MYRFEPDSLEEWVREFVRSHPANTDLAIGLFGGTGMDHIDVEAERSALLRRQEEQDREAIAVLKRSGRFDPETGEFAGTEEEAMALLDAAGVFDGWEDRFKRLCVLEYIRIARQRRN
jgi:hypothetical protein